MALGTEHIRDPFGRMQRTAQLRSIIVLLVSLFVCLCLSGCAQEQQEEQPDLEYKTELMDEGTLKVLTALDYPPFDAGSAEEPWGYDIAVAQEIANRLGLALEFVSVSRADIVSTLACEPSSKTEEEEEPVAPQGDIALAALAITAQRDDKVDFSSWYYVGNQAVVALDGAYQSTTELDRKKTRIAVVKGSTCLDTARSLTDDKLVVEYSSARKCLEALQAKEVQAVVLDLPVATYLLENEFTKMRIIERIMTGEAYGIAIPTQSSHLKDAINGALQEMEEDGTLERLEDEYVKSAR